MDAKELDADTRARMNNDLCDFSARWTVDGDYMRCTTCKRPHIASKADMDFAHQAGCKRAATSEPRPWHTLLSILAPLYAAPVAPAAAAQPDERTAFDVWMVAEVSKGNLYSTDEDAAWAAWQARATAPQVTTPTDAQIDAIYAKYGNGFDGDGAHLCSAMEGFRSALRSLLCAPQPMTHESTADAIDATFRRRLELRIQNLTVSDKNEITWIAIECRGVVSSLAIQPPRV